MIFHEMYFSGNVDLTADFGIFQNFLFREKLDREKAIFRQNSKLKILNFDKHLATKSKEIKRFCLRGQNRISLWLSAAVPRRLFLIFGQKYGSVMGADFRPIRGRVSPVKSIFLGG